MALAGWLDRDHAAGGAGGGNARLRRRRFGRLGLLGELLLQKCKLLLLRLQQRSLVGLEPRDFLAQRGELGIGGGGFRRGLLRSGLEEELTCELGAFNRLLLVACFLPHVVAHLDHHVADALAFLADVTEQGFGEGTVAAGPVQGHFAEFGRVDDHHAGDGLDPG